ncbi:protein MAINTENANCE OF MERISTEMS-like [Gossypium hirsutum]|uniref:Protein MAINTENANCE OF MERISTEMS-like n=1 Tax=Gossypium hirsutum TaxID=3635 RepID=A0A1U8KIM7_GOSHI|nr:protein MAINTENANCE OF MERISTEMS-like [Gossypium hirsutum]
MPYLELARFESAALNRMFDLRYNLISALVDRWCPETHTFHLSRGECTVTLEDVALHFGLPIEGSAVMGVSAIAEPTALFNATEEELMCAARAYIMHIIGGVLMPNANNNRVHLQYLPLLANLRNVRSYSWSSAVLAMLYRDLCRTTKPDAADIGGCIVLLQSWALYWMPFLASFIWMSYRRPEIAAIIPSSAYVDSQLWCTNASIINFNVVEWYHGDRILRQFSCIQYILNLPMQVGRFTALTREENMEVIGELCTENILRCGIIGWLEDLRWICLPICNHC